MLIGATSAVSGRTKSDGIMTLAAHTAAKAAINKPFIILMGVEPAHSQARQLEDAEHTPSRARQTSTRRFRFHLPNFRTCARVWKTGRQNRAWN